MICINIQYGFSYNDIDEFYSSFVFQTKCKKKINK